MGEKQTSELVGVWDDVANLVKRTQSALDEFSTETLVAMAEYQEMINKSGWISRMIRQYIEARRTSC